MRTRVDQDRDARAPLAPSEGVAEAHEPTASRVEQFRDDVADMRIHDRRANRERALGTIGVLACVAAIGIAIVAVSMSTSTSDPRTQRDAIVVGLLGVTVGLVGVGLALRWTIGRLLRFWLARFTFEQRHQTDRLIEVLGGRSSEGEDRRKDADDA